MLCRLVALRCALHKQKTIDIFQMTWSTPSLWKMNDDDDIGTIISKKKNNFDYLNIRRIIFF
jgi:hypothetical protein